ncbi:hypothetical protein ANN_08719 [Periplaneta americana]|uniref:Uncharacterized protein n=1 Tax=Periplaneta americana TaxID=6978 RepID=A0ABQ8T272_PERAM|nr:hypothetical protein ANN_08719 [Periplaneta americana]
MSLGSSTEPEMSLGSSTESYPAFACIGLRENPGKNLNQVTYPDRDSGFAARRADRYSTEFKLAPGGETLRDYVIPSLANKSSDEIVTLLRDTGITVASAASAVVNYHLTLGSIAEAAKVALRFRAYYSAPVLRRPLVQAYIRTEDRDSFITILRQIHDSVDRAVAADEESAGSVPDRTEIVGNFVMDIATFSRKNRPARIEAVLQGLLDQGLSLSNSSAERLQNKLGEELTSEISNLLGKLTSGDLVPSAVNRPAGALPGAMGKLQPRPLGCFGKPLMIMLWGNHRFPCFKYGNMSTEDMPHSGRPSTGRNDENIAKIKRPIDEDRRKTIDEVSEQMNLSWNTVQ